MYIMNHKTKIQIFTFIDFRCFLSIQKTGIFQYIRNAGGTPITGGRFIQRSRGNRDLHILPFCIRPFLCRLIRTRPRPRTCRIRRPQIIHRNSRYHKSRHQKQSPQCLPHRSPHSSAFLLYSLTHLRYSSAIFFITAAKHPHLQDACIYPYISMEYDITG